MRDFFKYVFASFVGLILFVTLGLGGLFVLLTAIASLSKETQPSLDQKTMLAFDLSLDIVDAPPTEAAGQVVGQALSGGSPNQAIALRTVLDTLEAAATDENIVGLYLYSGTNPSGGSGLATLSEVRQAMDAFRKAGKPIFAYEMVWTERDYYLASVANTTVLDPGGLLELNGFSAETPFFAGALQKYGIGIQVLRVGQYKSAIEPFTRTSRSPEDRQQTQKLLTDLWGEFLRVSGSNRKLTPEKMQAIADTKGIVLPTEAKSFGLIDRVAYEDELIAEFRKLTGETKPPEDEAQPFRAISLTDYAETVNHEPEAHSKNRIALIYAEGDIVSGEGSDGQIGGDVVAQEIRRLRLDDDVKAIVLRVNSPGGSASASSLMAREIKLAAAAKPVMVSMGSVAASGGYQISTYATRIFASPTTITGSIGVFGLLPNVQGISNQNGITWDGVKTGRYADLDTIARPKTAQELAVQQRVVDQIYQQFLRIVAEGRSLSLQRVGQIAQGRVWSGIEAKRIGLVDELGGLEAAIQAAAKAAKLGDDWQLDEYPKYRSFGEQILESLFSRYQSQTMPATDPLTVQFQHLQAELKTLQAMNDPLGIYARVIFPLTID